MKINHRLNWHVRSMMEIKKTERQWHFPLLAGVCIGVCLFVGWYFDKLSYGNLSSVGGLVILYFTHASLSKRMVHVCMAAFGLTFAFALGSVFSFHSVAAAFGIALCAFLTHLVTSYFQIPPPRDFFFIMVCAVGTNIPFDVEMLPTHVGLVAMGAMVSVCLAFFYSVFIAKQTVELPQRQTGGKKRYTKLVESLIIAVCCFIGLMIGHIFKMHSPYWIPVSAMAVIQGKDFIHTSERNFHRIVGTFVGLGLTWLILSVKPDMLLMVGIMVLLQFIIEMLIVRNYLYASIFITPLTILLAEAAGGNAVDPDLLMKTRLIDTVIGSLLGLATGWFLHHQTIISTMEKRLRGTHIRLRKHL